MNHTDFENRQTIAQFGQQLIELRGKYGRKGKRGGSSKSPTSGASNVKGKSRLNKAYGESADPPSLLVPSSTGTRDERGVLTRKARKEFFFMSMDDIFSVTAGLKKKYAGSKKNGIEILQEMTDKELFSYIAHATMSFGRSYMDSVENALFHIETNESKARAIKSFGSRHTDTLGAS